MKSFHVPILKILVIEEVYCLPLACLIQQEKTIISEGVPKSVDCPSWS